MYAVQSVLLKSLAVHTYTSLILPFVIGWMLCAVHIRQLLRHTRAAGNLNDALQAHDSGRNFAVRIPYYDCAFVADFSYFTADRNSQL
jgi:hypothetical protein